MILYHGTIESRGKKIVKDGKIDCHAERLNSESYEYIVENCMKVSEGSIKPKTLASTPGYTYCTNSLMYAIYYGNKNAILNNENEFIYLSLIFQRINWNQIKMRCAWYF